MIVMMRVVAVMLLAGCYRTEAKAPVTAPATAAPVVDAPPADVAVGDDRLYASLTRPERTAFCEQERAAITDELTDEGMRRATCRLKALPDLVTAAASEAAARKLCRKRVDECMTQPVFTETCENDEEKECPGITVADYRACFYEIRRELGYVANEDLCATMDHRDRERAFSRLDSIREGHACTVVRRKCGE